MFDVAQAGSVRFQLRHLWLLVGAASGLHILAGFAGDFGDFLSRTLTRVVLHYDAVIANLFRYLGSHLGVSFDGYEGQLTYSAIILIPYSARLRRVRFSGFMDDRWRILALLNLIAFTWIGNVISPIKWDRWATWLTVEIASLAIAIGCIVAMLRDDEYLWRSRAFIFVLFVSIYGIAMLGFSSELRHLNFVGLTIPGIVATALTAIAYIVGVVFRIDGYYPFLTGAVFFCVFYSFDYLLKYVAPNVDNYLNSIGA